MHQLKIYNASVKTLFEAHVKLQFFRIFRVVSLFNYQGSIRCGYIVYVSFVFAANFFSLSHSLLNVNHFFIFYFMFHNLWSLIGGGVLLYNPTRDMSSTTLNFFHANILQHFRSYFIRSSTPYLLTITPFIKAHIRVLIFFALSAIV